jgi:hypothetical protein
MLAGTVRGRLAIRDDRTNANSVTVSDELLDRSLRSGPCYWLAC